MGTSMTYPNGQVLTSTALTPAAISTLVQQLTLGALGLAPPGAAFDYAQVRVSWQTQGQPFQDATQARCYVECVPGNDPYHLVRNLTTSGSLTPSPTATQTWTYTRPWNVIWHFYGPSSTDDARAVWSSMFIDYFTDALSASNLFPVPDFKEPTRAPELINAQWWEHAVFEAMMYENVTETIQPGVVTSVEVKVYDQASTDINTPTVDVVVTE